MAFVIGNVLDSTKINNIKDSMTIDITNKNVYGVNFNGVSGGGSELILLRI